MNLLAAHAHGKGGGDSIFGYSLMAEKRASEIGKGKVVNATVGAFLNADGSLATLKTIEEAFKEVPFGKQAGYAPIDGMPQAVEAMIDSTFRDDRPDAFIGGVATPGGTGALHSAFFNYLSPGDCCITTDYYWTNYEPLLSENGSHLETFKTFRADGGFNLEGCLAKCQEVAVRQKNLMLLLNTPAHNPTGLSVSLDEWKVLRKELETLAREKTDGGVILLIDVAYIDFAGDGERRFFKCFENMPENMLVIVCASMSKGYTIYGYRLGCEICIAPTEEARQEFMMAAGATARSTWSNASRPAMEMIAHIYSTPEKRDAFRQEQTQFAASLARRGAVFTKEAQEVGLSICPYHSGFFVYVPTENHEKAEMLAEALRARELFVVPLGPGARIAICAVSEEKIVGMAKMIKEVQNSLGL